MRFPSNSSDYYWILGVLGLALFSSGFIIFLRGTTLSEFFYLDGDEHTSKRKQSLLFGSLLIILGIGAVIVGNP